MSAFAREVQGAEEYAEAIEVAWYSSENSKMDAADGLAVIDVHVESVGDRLYASLTLEQAEQHIKHVQEAIDFLKS